MENICKFVPVSSNNDVIHTINFVYEKENPGNILPVTNSVYRVNLVVSGSAVVTQSNIRKNVKKGDIYFIFQQHSVYYWKDKALEITLIFYFITYS